MEKHNNKIGLLAISTLAVSMLFLSSCSMSSARQDSAPAKPVDVSHVQNAVPKIEPRAKYGNPSSYVVFGKRYHVLKSAAGYNQVGYASWYGTKFHGQLTSSREPYDMFAMTAASTNLPLPTFVRVTNLSNNRSVIVKVNDRGPFASNRIIDLSYAAAKKLGYLNKGTALVRVTAINARTWAANQRRETLPAPQARSQVAVHEPGVFLQVGAFADRVNAERLRDQLAARTGSAVQIKEGFHNNAPIYRVQLGPLIGVAAYDRIRSELTNEGFQNPVTVTG